MSLELRVTPHRQTTPMSCWWACMRMVLEYYGHRYQFPQHYRQAFERNWYLPDNGLPRYRQPDLRTALRHDPTLERTTELVIMEPYEWYEHGVPNSRLGMRLLSSITSFIGVPDRPVFGQWGGEDIEEKLRQCGPYIFLGFWNGLPHAIVVTGFIQGTNDVVHIDPARGFPTPMPLPQFNSLMGQFRIRGVNDLDGSGLNPFYLHQDRPIREVVSDTP